jgi:two-component sensor histidine kinase/CHASE3 domain sensor protein
MTSRFVLRSTIGLLTVGLAALLFIVGAAIWLGVRAQHHLHSVIETRDLRVSANLLREALLSAESSQRGFVLTGNEIYLAPFENAKNVAEVELDRIVKALAGRTDHSAMIDRLATITRAKIKEMSETTALKIAGQDADAVALIRTNRGKAFMDEANVFISAIILEADERLTASVAEQEANARWLLWAELASGLAIALVVAGVVVMVHRHTRDLTAARDEVRRANESLEDRVAKRTQELARARDHAELLLTEVNHRVSNSLALVSSLVRLQMGALSDKASRAALAETEARIQAIAQMHRHLFTSGDVGQVAVDEYLTAILSQLEAALVREQTGVTIRSSLEPVKLVTGDAVKLGIIVTEWVTNAFKYAYSDREGEVRVRMGRSNKGIELVVEDDGIGRAGQKSQQGTGLGTRVVSAIAASMNAEIAYHQRQPGTGAHFLLPSHVQH